MHGRVQLLEFVLDLARDGRVADVRVDLARGRDADAHRFEALREVNDVRGDHHAAARDLGADQLGDEVLAPRDELHLGRDRALAGGFKLGHGGLGGRVEAQMWEWLDFPYRLPGRHDPLRFKGFVLSSRTGRGHPWR